MRCRNIKRIKVWKKKLLFVVYWWKCAKHIAYMEMNLKLWWQPKLLPHGNCILHPTENFHYLALSFTISDVQCILVAFKSTIFQMLKALVSFNLYIAGTWKGTWLAKTKAGVVFYVYDMPKNTPSRRVLLFRSHQVTRYKILYTFSWRQDLTGFLLFDIFKSFVC